jgi:hypothetical protein
VGLFDIFKGKTKSSTGGEKKSSPAAKYAEAAANKRAQAYDRQEALHELAKLKSADAVAALLKRFTFAVDPSITDQEEKQVAFDGILGAGKEAIEPVRAFAAKAESLSWPVRVLKELLSEEELVDELLVWLARWDTEYAKFIDPKLQLLAALEDYQNSKIRAAVTPFLEDVNEPARFHAVATILAQKDPESVDALLACLLDEESVRIRTKIADGLAQLGWEIPEEKRDAVRKVLPYEFGIDGTGHVSKRG